MHRATLEGGAVFFDRCGGLALVGNNVITGNQVVRYGAGIDVFSDSIAYISNNTIYGNSGGSGGGVACREGSWAEITNTILWNNSAAEGPELFLDMQQTGRVAEVDVRHSNVEGGQSSVHVDATCILLWGEGMIDQPPGFIDAGSGDFHLSGSSPCVNRGTSDVMASTDPEGDPRPTMGTADMGADEYVGTHRRGRRDGDPRHARTGGSLVHRDGDAPRLRARAALGLRLRPGRGGDPPVADGFAKPG